MNRYDIQAIDTSSGGAWAIYDSVDSAYVDLTAPWRTIEKDGRYFDDCLSAEREYCDWVIAHIDTFVELQEFRRQVEDSMFNNLWTRAEKMRYQWLEAQEANDEG